MRKQPAICRATIRRGLSAGANRIGLLGGSFNPAHPGHLHISQQALKLLALDSVWWLVSPQNPLKPECGMKPIEERIQIAKTVAGDRRITITDVESRMETRFTVDTVSALTSVFPEKHFVWIMGADNLVQIPKWLGWQQLFSLIPIAVFDRAPYSVEALAGQAANVFASSRLPKRMARRLADHQAPAWMFFHTPLHPAAATDIRAGN